MKIRENFSLRKYNTFNIESRCKYFIESDNESEWLDFVAQHELNPDEILILGGGSNYLFTGDFPGTVLYPTTGGIEKIEETETRVKIRVGAGVEWDDLVAWAVAHDYSGIENLALIPGHVGASPVQNIGAYGMEAGERIHTVEAIDLENACRVTIDADTCQFSYRNSIFKNEWKNRFLITYVTFELSRIHDYRLNYGNLSAEIGKMGGAVNLSVIRQAVIAIRNEKLPSVTDLPNAGSFFKNPVVAKTLALQLERKHPGLPVYPIDDSTVKLAAGWLIEQCGWKGRTLGNAGVYAKQALVLVNHGNASGEEIALLANEIKKSVFMRFGILIDPEVYVI